MKVLLPYIKQKLQYSRLNLAGIYIGFVNHNSAVGIDDDMWYYRAIFPVKDLYLSSKEEAMNALDELLIVNGYSFVSNEQADKLRLLI